MSDILHVENLNFSWGENHVLKDACFSIGSNQIVAILGINGAGKSTLLKCINKILNPSSGEIHLSGNDVKNYNLAQLATKISYVPQSVMTSFSMDVFDVVLLGRRPHLTWRISDKDRDLVSETLRYLDLEDFAFRRFDQLSGGERNRVHLAKILKSGSNLILLDEPTNDLDVETLRSLEEALLEFAGCAVIISHDRWFLDRIATHILAFEGNSSVVYFEGGYSDYEENRRKRLGDISPKRIKYRKLKRD